MTHNLINKYLDLVDLAEAVVFDITIVVVTGILSLLGGVLGVYWGHIKTHDTSFYKKKADDYQKECNYWRGRASKQTQMLKVDGDYNLGDDADITSLTKSVIPGVLDLLPKDVQEKARSLLNNPDIIDLGVELYKSHPKEIQSLLGGFLKKGAITTGDNTPELEAEAALQSSGGA